MKNINLTRGLVAIVDDEDYLELSKYNWNACDQGYAKRNIKSGNKQTTIKMHRVILGLSKNDDLKVDHINGNRCDNRKENLRVCCCYENSWNRGKNKNNLSGFKGVSLMKGGRYRAKILANGVMIKSYHSTPEEAYEAYCKYAKALHGEFHNLG